MLTDNCSAHPDELSSRDGSVTCMFLPPNTTSLIQQMDQGVLQAMKNRYKRKLLRKVICAQDLDQTQSIKDAVKLHTVKDALYTLYDAWDEAQNRSARLTINLKFTLTTARQIQNLNNSILPSQWLKCCNMSRKLVRLMLSTWKTGSI